MTAPLCDGGRCAQILAALAAARTVEKIGDMHSGVLLRVLGGVLARHGLDVSDAVLAAEVAEEIAQLTGNAPSIVEGVR